MLFTEMKIVVRHRVSSSSGAATAGGSEGGKGKKKKGLQGIIAAPQEISMLSLSKNYRDDVCTHATCHTHAGAGAAAALIID